MHLEVATNGLDFSTSGVAFTYEEWAIQSVTPLFGPELGGTVLTVRGARLPDTSQLMCMFGNSILRATEWVSSYIVTCQLPPLPLGDTPLKLRIIGEFPWRRLLGPSWVRRIG